MMFNVINSSDENDYDNDYDNDEHNSYQDVIIFINKN